MIQYYFSLRRFRIIKCSFFIHVQSTAPYIHQRLDSRIELKFSDCQCNGQKTFLNSFQQCICINMNKTKFTSMVCVCINTRGKSSFQWFQIGVSVFIIISLHLSFY